MNWLSDQTTHERDSPNREKPIKQKNFILWQKKPERKLYERTIPKAIVNQDIETEIKTAEENQIKKWKTRGKEELNTKRKQRNKSQQQTSGSVLAGLE